MAGGQPLNRTYLKKMIASAKAGNLFDLELIRKVSKKAGIKLPTSLSDMTLEERQQAVATYRQLKEAGVSLPGN